MRYFALLLIFCATSQAFAQHKYGVESSRLTFFSDGAVEDIRAVNTRVTSIFDAGRGDMAMLVRIKDFQFEKKLMQVHFNEKFLESEKYPKSTFMGHVSGFDPQKSGVQHVTASGRLLIHGVTREVQVPGTIELKDNALYLKTKFKIKLADYNIEIPQIVWQNIAEEVELDLNVKFSLL